MREIIRISRKTDAVYICMVDANASSVFAFTSFYKWTMRGLAFEMKSHSFWLSTRVSSSWLSCVVFVQIGPSHLGSCDVTNSAAAAEFNWEVRKCYCNRERKGKRLSETGLVVRKRNELGDYVKGKTKTRAAFTLGSAILMVLKW